MKGKRLGQVLPRPSYIARSDTAAHFSRPSHIAYMRCIQCLQEQLRTKWYSDGTNYIVLHFL